MRHLAFLVVLAFIFSCNSTPELKENEASENSELDNEMPLEEDVGPIFIQVLGNVQDGGSPHIGCQKECCRELFKNPDPERKVVSLGLIDQNSERSWMFEASPDFTEQCKLLKNARGFGESETADGVFLTHAHIGHYAGLMFLGKEAMNANLVPVYAMPRMKEYLSTNGPWSQLVTNENIVLNELLDKKEVQLTEKLKVIPFLVPHRDEFSETVGFKIIGPEKSALFIPDINKWEVWDTDIREAIAEVDYAFLDATFYGPEELKNRDMSEIPHPFIIESMRLFEDLDDAEKDKVYFIHLNHSNPVLDPLSEESKAVLDKGFHIARYGDKFGL